MAGDLVLITGVTGHLGFRVLFEALSAGYKVRAVARSQFKADKILSVPSIKKLNSGNNLEFVIVPDLVATGAFDEAIKGATYVIHVASPLPIDEVSKQDLDRLVVSPSLKGTSNMLEAANGAGANTVKRLVITSSANAIIPYSAIISPDPTKIWDGNWRNPDKKGPYEDVSDAYRAGKSMALNASERFIKENNPAFDIISIAPTFIIGANELVTDRASALQSSNYFVLKPVSGLDASYAPTAAIHLHDTALAHVRALDPKIPGNQVFVMNVIPNWTDMFQIVKREFPEAVKSGQLPNNGNIIPVPITADGSRTEEVLGIKFRSYEEMVKNVVAHYISLSS